MKINIKGEIELSEKYFFISFYIHENLSCKQPTHVTNLGLIKIFLKYWHTNYKT